MSLALLLSLVWGMTGAMLPPPALWLWVGLPPSTIMGVLATDEGLRQYHGWRAGRLIRWHEARLLEVEHENGKSATREYALFSDSGLITWNGSLSLDSDRNPDGVSAEEWAEDQRALLDLVVARTGLTPRTFEPALARARAEIAFMPTPAEPAPTQGRHPVRDTAAALIAVAIIVGGLLVMAEAVLALPLTTVPVLNQYTAGSIAFVGLSLLLSVPIGWLMLARSRRRDAAEVRLPPPPPIGEEQAVDLAYRWTWYQRLLVGFYSLILTSWLLAGLISFCGVVTAVAIALVVIGLIGAIFLLLAATGQPITTIRANATGLQVVSPRASQAFIPWDEGSQIAYVVSASGDEFVVLGKADGGKITWPVRALARVSPWSGNQSISPEELAALVARRSGVPLTVRRKE